MKVKHIASHQALEQLLRANQRSFLLLYKSGSENSDCALEHFSQAASEIDEKVVCLAADVNQVRDIHGRYGITTAPTLLEFEGDDFTKSVKGCQTKDYYVSWIRNKLYVSHHQDDQPKKRVVVYSTPSCPHCNNLKNYLRRNQVHFRDIDVSKDQKMAQELVKKSGQQGVPQTEINGRIVVGFNKPKIDEMLGIP
jgi:glutaredoxin-like YruB-family protein